MMAAPGLLCVRGGGTMIGAKPGRANSCCRLRAGPIATPPAPPPVGRRRAALALAEAALELGVACWWETQFRPKAKGDEELGAAGRAASLQYFRYPEEVRAEAQHALELGDRLSAAGEWSEAVDAYSRVLEVAPRQYRVCQAALAGRAAAWDKLGDSDKRGEDNFSEWLWGRGIRWPGHYIIAYILGRRAFVPPLLPPPPPAEGAPRGRRGAGARPEPPVAREEGGGGFSWAEGALICLLGAAYLYVLYFYGLEQAG